ncbi:MAG: hypothetical protein WC445_02790 [Patescibacteria group bacterium]
MENQPITQPASPKKFPVIAVLISVVLTALIVGGGVYWWQNMESKEAEPTVPESASVQTTIVKPTVTSPLSGATVENSPEGIKITGKATPNYTVWLFPVSEMDPSCLSMASNLTGGDKVDAGGNFEIIYEPTGEMESWPSEFVVVSLDENQEYQLSWVNGVFCAPDEAKSDSFKLTLKPATTPTTYTNSEYGFSLVFPVEWGAIEEKDVLNLGADKIVKAMDLVSKINKDRWIKIDIVRLEDKNDPENIDYPHTFIKENNQYAFYYQGAGDFAGAPGMENQKWSVIADEIKQIIKTFTLK